MHLHPNDHRHAVGLAEMLIAVAIVATLLSAVAMATHASFVAYGINQVQSDTAQRARLAVDRMLGSIRITEDHAPLDPDLRAQFASGLIVDDEGLAMFDAAGDEIHWAFDRVAGELHLVTTDATYVMLHDVRDFRVTFEPMKSAGAIRVGGDFDVLKRATVLVTVGVPASPGVSSTSASRTFTLSASVVPRRNVGI